MENPKFLTFAKTAMKNLFTKPYTVQYPAKPAQFPERMRGHIVIQPEDCICCGLCMRNCPPGAITVDRAAGTWSINRFDCIQCGSCTIGCPKKCLQIVPGYTTPDTQKQTETVSCPNRPAPPAKPAGPADAKKSITI
ncbi:MAG: 4Fe-4S dicluster domain-containing protein [Clostridium sp.]|nr:4Fe-4S dicluster domain-containing protein [Clostridiaceae bacterium]MDY5484436.1 4Fe-4S dicluster domain-containing protein [Clostridium sp.]